MTIIEVDKRVRLLLFVGFFFAAIFPLSFLINSVLGFGASGSFLAVLVSFLLTLLAFLILRRGRS